MKTDTANKILNFIKQNRQATPKEIINFIGFSAPAVFRQLKKMTLKGLIQKTGTPPKVFYYLPMDKKVLMTQEVFAWLQSTQPATLNIDQLYCSTRDVFEARNQRVAKLLIDSGKDDSFSYLLSAVIGELGNNSFDHNIANWPDVPGVYFRIDTEARFVIIADRGRGVRATLQNIRPDINSDLSALRVAFTEVISGRSPEQRGNGLKFVRNSILNLELDFKFYSGNAAYSITNKTENFVQTENSIRGTITLISF
ncbi:MAG: hypothetical protein UR53_C0001G0027 [Candidatus Magasanikbacteria bacterium GW2011_GWC2_34_16]|uniref:HTH arsR-type domain-containing protein n=2 Tax=Candidatus Magasanikiibacteriota TaxID=1752731 RepID=A0A0G0JVW8_9BACT|nr:MAG: hypothetical protein UR53_C0001G0027 [Candidatus Magasanikbacteria bacterium GW2011_GWC2_34_16]KKQ41044.1 MAG: hypothetical protein US58_C0006G0023 [Candidatus Magasanikbacteria bacterium GW2011_GWA2_37_8]